MANANTADLYQFHLQNAEPEHYTRIPNILGHLTYELIDPTTKEVTTRKLSPQARELYRVIKQTAGEGGACWKNTQTLAEECGMGAASICRAKEELCQNFKELDGSPLIVIKKTYRHTIKQGKLINKAPNHTIMVVDIWKWNNAFWKTKHVHKGEARSHMESAEEARSHMESAPQRARSNRERNKISDKIPLSENKQPSPSAQPMSNSACSPNRSKGRVFPNEDCLKAYEWLIQQGMGEGAAYKISTNYSIEEIRSSIQYINKRVSSGKQKPSNKWGYFINTLRNRYWEKNVS